MRKLLLCLGIALLSQSANPAWAVTTGILEGDFSDPNYGNSPPQLPAIIANGASASTIRYGSGNVKYGTDYSEIAFVGATVPLENTQAPILLGTIVYLNGTSQNSVIASAELTFSLDGITLGSDHVVVTSTTNLYSNNLDVTRAQAKNDADYLNICGPGSNICSKGIQAYEDTEGFSGVPFSTPVVAALYGTYSVDPSIDLTDVTYVSGDGVVSGRPAPSVPEPSTWAMMIVGFAGLGYAGYRRTRAARATA
jgi:hypothetical protein